MLDAKGRKSSGLGTYMESNCELELLIRMELGIISGGVACERC